MFKISFEYCKHCIAKINEIFLNSGEVGLTFCKNKLKSFYNVTYEFNRYSKQTIVKYWTTFLFYFLQNEFENFPSLA